MDKKLFYNYSTKISICAYQLAHLVKSLAYLRRMEIKGRKKITSCYVVCVDLLIFQFEGKKERRLTAYKKYGKVVTWDLKGLRFKIYPQRKK